MSRSKENVNESIYSGGIKRQMEEQPAMKKTGSKTERTIWTLVLGSRDMEGNEQNGTVTTGHMKRPQNE
jgi:hypothetical protein